MIIESFPFFHSYFPINILCLHKCNYFSLFLKRQVFEDIKKTISDGWMITRSQGVEDKHSVCNLDEYLVFLFLIWCTLLITLQ